MTQAPATNVQRPRALADIHFNDYYHSDAGTSSEDESFPHVSATDAHSLVGTPAVEKIAALEEAGGFFGQDEGLHIQQQDETYPNVASSACRTHEDAQDPIAQDGQQTRGRLQRDRIHSDAQAKESPTQNRLPSPWRARSREFQFADRPRNSIFGDSFLRRRRDSPEHGQANSIEQWQSSFLSNFSGFPKYFSLSSPFVGRRSSASIPKDATSNSRNTLDPAVYSLDGSGSSKVGRMRSRSDVPPLNRSTSSTVGSLPPTSRTKSRDDKFGDLKALPRLNTRNSYLRRSASDHSLQLQSALSRVSSLGDDSRFEHVQGQVNSRLKAIKDTWQDSSIKLPSFPAMPNLNFDSFMPDFYTSGKNNLSRRGLSNDTAPREMVRENSTELDNPAPTQHELKQHVKSTGRVTAGGPTDRSAITHPHFTKACAEQEGDLVILGGYRGSILRSAEPPHHQLWVPIKVGLNLRKVDLELGPDLEDDENSESKVIPGGMLTHIGPVDITRRLFRRLRACENARTGRLRVHDYGYDWRLDPLVLSRKLIEYLEKLPCNQPGTLKHKRGATVIAHSLGGLITRHAINQRPDLFAGVVFAGVPSRCVNILGPLRNGDDVLLSSRVLTAQVNFLVRTSFALLPLDGQCFFNKETKEEFPVDFFDPQTWIDYRLSPCVARPLPSLNPPPASMFSSLGAALPNIPGKRASMSFLEYARNAVSNPKEKTTGSIAKPSNEPETAQSVVRGNVESVENHHSEPHVGTELAPSDMNHEPPSTSVATTVTIAHDRAVAYLTRTLARVKAFKLALDYDAAIADHNAYPPAAVIYGKSTPTVYGAKVKDREAIKHAGAYDDLAFASGDGVVLAKASMLPDGYEPVRGGIISTDRGHITLLGDLEAVGRALNAVRRGKEKGVGMGARTWDGQRKPQT